MGGGRGRSCMRARPLAASAFVLATFAALAPSAAAATQCVAVPTASWDLCAGAEAGDSVGAGAWGRGADGSDFTLTASHGTGFYGNYVYVIGVVYVADTARVHGGLGLADRAYDGVYEDACVCGGVQTTFLYVPWGVGIEDTDGDGLPDHPYVMPQLG